MSTTSAISDFKLPTRRLEPSRGWNLRRLSEIWAYRELLYFMVWRDIKVRYKQTALGAGWAVIQPLLTMVVFSVIFGQLAEMKSDGLPWPVFSMAALVPWTYFSTALSGGSQSVVANQNVISKIYFPRLLIPLASVIAPLVDFAIAFVVLMGIMFWYGVVPGVTILWLPALLLLAVLTASAASIWLAAFNVQYRDVRYVVPFLVQIWMWGSPVVYPSSQVVEKFGPGWALLYSLNPMTGVIEGFRWALTGRPAPSPMTLVSAGIVVVTLLSGAAYFRRLEGTFADRI